MENLSELVLDSKFEFSSPPIGLDEKEISKEIDSINQFIEAEREAYKERYSGTDVAFGNFSFKD